MGINKIPLTLEVLEHLRTHIMNQGTDFCNFDIEVSKTFSGRASVRFIDIDNGVVIEQYFLDDDNDNDNDCNNDISDQEINMQILLRRRDFPF